MNLPGYNRANSTSAVVAHECEAAPALNARFYFYLQDEAAARAAKSRLEAEGLAVDLSGAADNASWLALGTASLASDDELDEYEERLHQLAQAIGAECDGYDRS